MPKNYSVLLLIFLLSCNNNPGKTKIEKIDHVMKKAYASERFVGNVLVSDSGHIIYKMSFGKADAQLNVQNNDSTKFLIASLSKPITAIIILRLVDQGLLKLEDQISGYFELKNPDISKVTIHQLLTHSSGIAEFIGKEKYSDVSTLNSAILKFKPGSDFEYSNSCYVLLAKIAEQITGKKYEELVKREVFDLADMMSSGVARNNHTEIIAKGYKDATERQPATLEYPLENVDGAGSLYSTTEDLYKLDKALRTNILLTKKMSTLMLRPHIPEKYAYGWFIRERGGIWDVYWHKGDISGFTSFMSRRTNKNQLVVLLANSEKLQLSVIENDISRILRSSD